MSERLFRDGDVDRMIAKLRERDPDERLKLVWEWVQQGRINFYQFRQLVRLVEIDGG